MFLHFYWRPPVVNSIDWTRFWKGTHRSIFGLTADDMQSEQKPSHEFDRTACRAQRHRSGEGYKNKMLRWRLPKTVAPIILKWTFRATRTLPRAGRPASQTEKSGEKGLGKRGQESQPLVQHSTDLGFTAEWPDRSPPLSERRVENPLGEKAWSRAQSSLAHKVLKAYHAGSSPWKYPPKKTTMLL